MLRVGPYLFKKAETEQEFQQIHGLNYRTFVTEIGQYADPGTGHLIDKFHHKNTYFIGVRNGKVVGMLSVHDQPPFSITDRLADPAVLTQPGMSILEVRLLAVEPDERHTSLFLGLSYVTHLFALKEHKTHLVISGVTGRKRLYQRLGFEPLGPAVPNGKSSFIPMIVALHVLPKKLERLRVLWENRVESQLSQDDSEWLNERAVAHQEQETSLGDNRICLLPGPVTVSDCVRRAFQEAPLYHRGPRFIRRFAQVRATLGSMVGGREVALFSGSGTLGNETVAANLAAACWTGRGLMLVNGEFGERLEKQAARFGLRPRVLYWKWGQPWNLDEVDAALAQESAGWVWGVHQESSTGVLNDLSGLVRVANKHNTAVCADCISSLGAVPLELTNVLLATGTSGKSLGAYAGAAIVFADPRIIDMVDRNKVPSYFDIAAALANDGPCYTFPSSTLLALEAALAEYETAEKALATYQRYFELGLQVRDRLRQLGLEPLASEVDSSPVITTFAPPDRLSPAEFVRLCSTWGVAIGGQSGYLARRGLVQIATMGAVSAAMCTTLFQKLADLMAPPEIVAT